jgi:cytochrome c peroxidase
VFEATLITPNAPFDRYLGGQADALSPVQKQGLTLFLDKGCASCHSGVNVGGGMYAPFGVAAKPGADLLPPGDKGRYAVTKSAGDEYVFKVPTLRNIALTAPYFHTGVVWDLRQAVATMGTSQLGTFRRRDRQDHRLPRQPDGGPAQGDPAHPPAKQRGDPTSAALGPIDIRSGRRMSDGLSPLAGRG